MRWLDLINYVFIWIVQFFTASLSYFPFFYLEVVLVDIFFFFKSLFFLEFFFELYFFRHLLFGFHWTAVLDTLSGRKLALFLIAEMLYMIAWRFYFIFLILGWLWWSIIHWIIILLFAKVFSFFYNIILFINFFFWLQFIVLVIFSIRISYSI